MHLKNISRFLPVILILGMVLAPAPLLTAQAPEPPTGSDPASVTQPSQANQPGPAIDWAALEKKVAELMEEGDIPGLSLVIARENEPVYMKGFGFADAAGKVPVTPSTLFELCSTSKAFTALAVLQCQADGLLDLDAPISRYFPWFFAIYEGQKQEISIRQLLHQTSGLPFRSIDRIPPSTAPGALEQTVRNLVGIELDEIPGKQYRYATANYAILGAIIEKVSALSYEEYMEKNIFRPLGMNDTYVGRQQLPAAGQNIAVGHKISFFKARPYDAPVFRGNNPAGYIISNGSDMARWLKLQMGLEDSPLTPLIQQTQQRNRSVPPDQATLLSYAMGWMIPLDGTDIVLHSGQNPNYTAYVMFSSGTAGTAGTVGTAGKTGLVLLANSNTTYTPYIGRTVFNLLHGEEPPPEVALGDSIDSSSSVISIILGIYVLLIGGFFTWVIVHIVKEKRKFAPLRLSTIGRWLAAPIFMLPYAAGIYLLPQAIAGVSWTTAATWSSTAFVTAAKMIVLVMLCTYAAYIFSTLFPHGNKYIRSAPFLVLISLLSGGANAVVIFLLSMSLYAQIPMRYIFFYFCLAGFLYLLGRKVLQARLVGITFDIIYDLRMRLIDRIFTTSYQKFEKLDSGRVVAVLNNDTTQLGNMANVLVTLLSSLITVTGAFIFLGAIAFWTTLVTLAVIFAVATIYYIVTRRARDLFNIARDTQNDYLSQLNGMNDGFKELTLHSAKKVAYKKDIADITERFRSTSSHAMIKFVNAFMVGESMLVMVLAAVAFGIPTLLPHIRTSTLMSFIMVLLYLIGPVTAILNVIPGLTQLQIAWGRVQGLMRDIPGNLQAVDKVVLPTDLEEVQEIEAKGVFFEYEGENDNEKFAVGPLDFSAKKGEIIFIIGGNGSGKTTLARLLTGLYVPDEGKVMINGRELSGAEIGEYFSVIFGDYHLFEKLYDVSLDSPERRRELDDYLQLLRIQEKVKVENNAFSTIELSGGQRKRLALLRCYLEDRPIYLFDEVAADQDPEFRKFFYRTLLKRMKEKGKTVIAITHDDHYFDAADRVVKMELGQIEKIDNGAQLRVTA